MKSRRTAPPFPGLCVTLPEGEEGAELLSFGADGPAAARGSPPVEFMRQNRLGWKHKKVKVHGRQNKLQERASLSARLPVWSFKNLGSAELDGLGEAGKLALLGDVLRAPGRGLVSALVAGGWWPVAGAWWLVAGWGCMLPGTRSLS